MVQTNVLERQPSKVNFDPRVPERKVGTLCYIHDEFQIILKSFLAKQSTPRTHPIPQRPALQSETVEGNKGDCRSCKLESKPSFSAQLCRLH